MTDLTVSLAGWVHVHTWHESHGSHTETTYQLDDRAWTWSRRKPQLLIVATYRDGRPSHVRMEHDHDYLLARAILANVDGAYTLRGERYVSPCYTAGHDDYDHAPTGRVFRVVSAAGHGDWAFDATDEIEPA